MSAGARRKTLKTATSQTYKESAEEDGPASRAGTRTRRPNRRFEELYVDPRDIDSDEFEEAESVEKESTPRTGEQATRKSHLQTSAKSSGSHTIDIHEYHPLTTRLTCVHNVDPEHSKHVTAGPKPWSARSEPHPREARDLTIYSTHPTAQIYNEFARPPHQDPSRFPEQYYEQYQRAFAGAHRYPVISESPTRSWRQTLASAVPGYSTPSETDPEACFDVDEVSRVPSPAGPIGAEDKLGRGVQRFELGRAGSIFEASDRSFTWNRAFYEREERDPYAPVQFLIRRQRRASAVSDSI